ncbi:hypothetical protein CC80DRAFT_549892 [Byssothecium circinans]|uniref:Uncharacterized protein n=1 Tax=Byssothecium circinans TaxID=147558 RepID=A0A6A5TRW5_9PLEO|nr:hypothetical protein CC80DRAFT_549892 [Byssothecium circinans]
MSTTPAKLFKIRYAIHNELRYGYTDNVEIVKFLDEKTTRNSPTWKDWKVIAHGWEKSQTFAGCMKEDGRCHWPWQRACPTNLENTTAGRTVYWKLRYGTVWKVSYCGSGKSGKGYTMDGYTVALVEGKAAKALGWSIQECKEDGESVRGNEVEWGKHEGAVRDGGWVEEDGITARLKAACGALRGLVYCSAIASGAHKWQEWEVIGIVHGDSTEADGGWDAKMKGTKGLKVAVQYLQTYYRIQYASGGQNRIGYTNESGLFLFVDKDLARAAGWGVLGGCRILEDNDYRVDGGLEEDFYMNFTTAGLRQAYKDLLDFVVVKKW